MSKVPRAGKSSRYHHGDLRRALLDAALEILSERSELSLRAVARKAGVSHAAPYHHFPDRRSLVAAIAGEGLAAFREALLTARRRASDPSYRMLEVGTAYVRFAVENPAHFRLMFSEELSDRSGLPDLRAAYEAAYAVLAAGVREVVGEQAPEDQVHLQATASWSLVHGLANLILDNQLGEEARTPERAEALARSVLMRSPPGSAEPRGQRA